MTGSRFGALASDREFLKLWSGETVAQIGAQMAQLALPLAAVYSLHATSGQLGIVNAMSYAPFLGISLLVGVWVDRRLRRPLMVGSNVGRAALLATVPVASWLGLLRIEYLYVVALAVGVLTVVFDVSYQSYLPSLIDRRHLVEGNSKLQASTSVAQVGGPGLGGVLVGLLGAPVTLLVTAATYACSVATLVAIRRPEPPARVPETPVSTWRSIKEGMGVVLGNPYLRACALESGTYNLCWMSLQTVFVLYAARVLGMAPGTIGLLFGLGAAGSMVGAVAAGWSKRRLGLGPAIVTELVVCCCAPLLAAVAPGGTTLGVVMYVATFVLCGMGATMSTVHIVSLRQSITEDGMLGRVNAGCRFLAWGPLPLGALFGGFLSESIGLPGALRVTCVSFVLALLWVIFSPVPRVRDIADVGRRPTQAVAVPAGAATAGVTADTAVESGAP